MTAEEIVRRLAECDPFDHAGEWSAMCRFCHGAMTVHVPECLWRAAVEWVAAQEKAKAANSDHSCALGALLDQFDD